MDHQSRLAAHAQVFDRLISEFKQYGPILAQIKRAYDYTLSQRFTNEEEVRFLRAKVQKLMAQNENRMLLKVERDKALRLESEVKKLLAENDGYAIHDSFGMITDIICLVVV